MVAEAEINHCGLAFALGIGKNISHSIEYRGIAQVIAHTAKHYVGIRCHTAIIAHFGACGYCRGVCAVRFAVVVGAQFGYCLGGAVFHALYCLAAYVYGAIGAWLEHSHHATLAVGILKCHMVVVDAHIYYAHHHSGAGIRHGESGACMHLVYIGCRTL